MNQLCIIPCGANKIWSLDPRAGAVAAKNVYISPFAKKCQAYAEKFYPDEWVILSAKYGFLRPDDLIPGPYNVSFNDRRTNPISTSALEKMALDKGLLDVNSVVVLGGKQYVKMAQVVFRRKEIITPLSDCSGIGYMMGKLNQAILRGQPI